MQMRNDRGKSVGPACKRRRPSAAIAASPRQLPCALPASTRPSLFGGD